MQFGTDCKSLWNCTRAVNNILPKEIHSNGDDGGEEQCVTHRSNAPHDLHNYHTYQTIHLITAPCERGRGRDHSHQNGNISS